MWLIIIIKIDYNYTYNNEIIIPKNFFNNYNNQTDFIINNSNIIVHNSNTYLTNSIEGYPNIIIDTSPNKIIREISSNISQRVIPIEINNSMAIKKYSFEEAAEERIKTVERKDRKSVV